MTLKILAFLLLIPNISFAAAFQFGGIKHDITSQVSTVSPIILSAASTQVQRVTGSTAQVLKLPSATTLRSGYWYFANNESSATLTVSDSSSTALAIIPGGSAAYPNGAFFYLASNALTTGPWTVSKTGDIAGASSLGTCNTAKTIDWSLSKKFTVTLTNSATCAFTYSNATSGQTITLDLYQPSSSGGTGAASWSTTTLWSGGSAPTITTGNSKTDTCTITYNGTDYRGSCVQDMR